MPAATGGQARRRAGVATGSSVQGAHVRIAALELLLKFDGRSLAGQASKMIERLDVMIGHEDNVADVCMQLLKNMGKEVIETHLELIKQQVKGTPERLVKLAGLRMLDFVGPHACDKYVKEIVGLLADVNADVRNKAVETLSKMCTPDTLAKAIDEIMEHLSFQGKSASEVRNVSLDVLMHVKKTVLAQKSVKITALLSHTDLDMQKIGLSVVNDFCVPPSGVTLTPLRGLPSRVYSLIQRRGASLSSGAMHLREMIFESVQAQPKR